MFFDVATGIKNYCRLETGNDLFKVHLSKYNLFDISEKLNG